MPRVRPADDELFLECPHCGAEIELPGALRNLLGEAVQCPRCLKHSTLGGTPEQVALVTSFAGLDRDD